MCDPLNKVSLINPESSTSRLGARKCYIWGREGKLSSTHFTMAYKAFCFLGSAYFAILSSITICLTNQTPSTWPSFSILPRGILLFCLRVWNEWLFFSASYLPTAIFIDTFNLLLYLLHSIQHQTKLPNLFVISLLTVWTLWRNKHKAAFFFSSHSLQPCNAQFSFPAS